MLQIIHRNATWSSQIRT